MQFTQNDIEKDLSDIVPHGVRRDVARDTGIYESVVYGYFNAEDERKSPAFCLLLIQAAMDNKHPAVGDAHWAAICRFRELSKPQTIAGRSVDDELARSVKEDADVVIAHVEHKSLYDQLREVDESMAQKRELRAAILAAINNEKESFNGGRTRINGHAVSYETRDLVSKRVEVKAAVAKRRAG